MNHARLDLGVSWIAARCLSGCRLKFQLVNERKQCTIHPVFAYPCSALSQPVPTGNNAEIFPNNRSHSVSSITPERLIEEVVYPG